MTPTVLFICGHPPWPPISGGRRREYEIIRRLRALYRVEVCAVDKEAPPGASAPIPGGPVTAVAFGPTGLDGETALECQHASAPARAWIERRLRRGDIDLIHCEGFFLRQLLPEAVDVPLVIGTQNVEWQLIAQRHRVGNSEVARLDERDLTVAREREEEVLREADTVICVTGDDAAALAEAEIGAQVVPDGCDHLRRGDGTGRPVDVALIANFAYAPNRDAGEVLCSAILPELRARLSPVSTRLVGNQATHFLWHLESPDIEIVGRVPSIVDHIADASVIVCPLRIGGGIKVKVLEALHAGAAVVCSTVAAQGMADHGGALIVEDDWPRFAAAIGELLERPDRLAAQRAAARSYAQTLPRWDEATALLDGVWRDAVAAGCGNEVL